MINSHDVSSGCIEEESSFLNGSAVFPFVETSENKQIDEDRESFELAVDPVTFLVKDGLPNNS
jgi:hypothetical protein